MNALRLLKLADYLDERVAREQFDMSRWTWRGNNNVEWGSCGTTACALGHGAMMPEFIEAGLRLSPHGVPKVDTLLGNASGIDAGAIFFSIPRRASMYFFYANECDEDGYETRVGGYPVNRREFPSHVAARIRDYVNKHMSD